MRRGRWGSVGSGLQCKSGVVLSGAVLEWVGMASYLRLEGVSSLALNKHCGLFVCPSKLYLARPSQEVSDTEKWVALLSPIMFFLKTD